ncbi:MAG: methionyl-tRNA formyltransferase, partial [Candidatus Uhrbacteria bacterium]|nr:methionyl-tRNA formyltransferase [Patescibacteria group bacterium]MBU1906730.1 methionyl-tRNA formyltransferase [Patescibacteria group bacterium]
MTRVVFFGTPKLAVPFLKALNEAPDFDVVAVVTQPDKPVGRKQELTPTPVKDAALELDLPVLELKTLKHEIPQGKLKDLKPDLFVVFAYGKIIPQVVLDIAPALNVHPSALPAYRGPSPLQSAILNGDKTTAVSIMLLDEEMDHGPILVQKPIALDARETVSSLEGKVINVGAPLLINVAKAYLAGDLEPQEQDHKAATICKIIEREDSRIDWTQTAEQIDQKIRAFENWPGTYSVLTKTDQTELRLKILEAKPSLIILAEEPGTIMIDVGRLLVATGSGALELIEVQPEGKKKMNAAAFMQGYSELSQWKFVN